MSAARPSPTSGGLLSMPQAVADGRSLLAYAERALFAPAPNRRS